MANRLSLTMILVAATLWTAPAWCGFDPDPQVLQVRPGFFKVADMMGREREVKRPIRRAMVLGGAATETVWALGAGERIIARSDWTNWPPALEARPSIGSVVHPNLELIWKLKPDLIIADTHFFNTAEKMESLGIPVVFMNGYFQGRIKGMVKALAELFQQEERGQELNGFLDRQVRLLDRRLGDLTPEERPRVFLGSGRQLYFTSNDKRGRQIIPLAGGRNISDALPLPYQRVSAEWIVDQAPDHLALSADLTGVGFKVPDREYMAALREEAMNRPGIRGLKCTARGRVYLYNSRIGYGLRNLIGALHLAKVFHPGKMAEVDPRAIHREMLGRFFGLEMDGTYFIP